MNLRCISKENTEDVCGGELRSQAGRLLCTRCSRVYAIVAGIPIVREKSDSNWYEEMYSRRSRTNELGTDYLRIERKYLSEFVSSTRICGPTLEIGCGVGLCADIMPGYIGLEYSLSSLLADGFEDFSRVCADARILPWAAQSFECVFSFNTLEHVNQVDTVFIEIDRVLKPGGFAILKPAWHCTRYITELLPIKPYRELSYRKRVKKLLIPLLRSRIFKIAAWVPRRTFRRMMGRADPSLQWKSLTPYYGPEWIPDSDAVASIDSHEAILFFEKRKYQCVSHKHWHQKILAGHDIVVVRKPESS